MRIIIASITISKKPFYPKGFFLGRGSKFSALTRFHSYLHLNPEKKISKEERKKSLLEKYPLPAELADKLNLMHYEWASKAFSKGVPAEQILKEASELEEYL